MRRILFAGGLALLTLSIAAFFATDDYWVHTFEHKQLDTEFYCEGATFGDVSGDGQADLIAGPFWFEGPDFAEKNAFYEPKTFPISFYSDCFFSFVYDFDADNLNDILVYGFPGQKAAWYRNPGSVERLWEKHEIFEGVDNESPTFEDITGDGKPEMVFLHQGQYGYAEPNWEKPAEPWPFRAIGEKRDLGKYTHGLGVGDVDGDGKKDLLEAKGWYQQVEGDGFWTYHPYDFAQAGSQMFAYDFDGDGDNDVMSADLAHSWGLLLHENNGDQTFERHVIMGETPEENRYGVAFSQLHAMALVDMDGDGIKDLVTGKRYWAHMGKDPGGKMDPVLYWFKTKRNEGSEPAVEFIPFLIGDKTGVGTQVVVEDYNGDNLPDIVVANKKGIAVYTHNKVKATSEQWQNAQPQRLGN